MGAGQHTSPAPPSFSGLLLRHRGRTRLTQRDLAARSGVSLRSIQDWEAGITCPSAERLQGLIHALLEAGSLTTGREEPEARELWTAAVRVASRMHTPFDEYWFAELLAAHARTPEPMPDTRHLTPVVDPAISTAERAMDWGEAPDAIGFV